MPSYSPAPPAEGLHTYSIYKGGILPLLTQVPVQLCKINFSHFHLLSVYHLPYTALSCCSIRTNHHTKIAYHPLATAVCVAVALGLLSGGVQSEDISGPFDRWEL